ncbi:hypothetical protein ACFYPW_17035 [Micromonospora zamorensis]|uniref:hypothetical protein n=1 Tax=Micromonospora zamorensis TaxID=709883 RepID=UPI0036860924
MTHGRSALGMGIGVVVQLVREDVSRSDTSAAPATRRRGKPTDWIAMAVLLALIPVIHDLRTTLTASYWLDEAWVALSVRLPLSDLPVATSSTPLGWSFLLQLVPDTDYLRVVPIAFHGLSVVAAYVLGRSLHWPTQRLRVVAGFVSGAAVLLLPAQQIRHDLKHYTADAAVTVALLALGAWAERTWSRRRLGVITAAVAGGMLFSHVTAIAAPCVFGGLLLVTAMRQQWDRLREVVVAGLCTVTIIVIIYFSISAQGKNDAMQRFWTDSFPSLTELPGYLGQQIDALTPVLGAPALVVGALLVAGVVTIVRQGRPACATAVVLLPVAVTTLGVARSYPLLELRTSHFLLVTTATVAGIGVVGLAHGVVTIVRRGVPQLPPTVATVAICAVLLTTFGVHNERWYRFDGNESGLYYTAISVTDIRSSTEYVATHRSRNDVVVVNAGAWYGFAFYSNPDPVKLVARYGNTVGWWVDMPTRSDVVVVRDLDEQAIRAGLTQALALAGRRGGARIWLIRSHVIGEEANAWRTVLADYRVEQAFDGVEPVMLISEG